MNHEGNEAFVLIQTAQSPKCLIFNFSSKAVIKSDQKQVEQNNNHLLLVRKASFCGKTSD